MINNCSKYQRLRHRLRIDQYLVPAPRIKQLRIRFSTSAQCKKKRLFYESLKINRKKGKEILLFFCLLFVLLFFYEILRFRSEWRLCIYLTSSKAIGSITTCVAPRHWMFWNLILRSLRLLFLLHQFLLKLRFLLYLIVSNLILSSYLVIV